MELFKGPDFATGGHVIDSARAISDAYATGRGSFRVRGVFHAAEAKDPADRATGIERLGGGQWQLVISEIPYQVPKGKLIEQIAARAEERRVGKECVSTCRTLWSPAHNKNKQSVSTKHPTH